MKPISNKNIFLFFILLFIALEAVMFSASINKINLDYLNRESKFTEIQNILDSVSVQAKAVSVYDQTINRKIYGKNDEGELPIASLTKIMTVIVVLNSHKIDDVISMPLNAIKQEGDYGIVAGEKFDIKDLAKFTLIGSSNDGAYALSENSDNFIDKMNDKALKLGMESTLFFNTTGLDIDDGFAGAYASAQDVNTMAIYALRDYPEVFSASVMPKIEINSLSGIKHSIKNTDTILNKVPNMLFSKTGYTPLAGGNLSIIYKNKYGHEIAITVLGSTIDGRFQDMEKIIDTLSDIDYGSQNKNEIPVLSNQPMVF